MQFVDQPTQGAEKSYKYCQGLALCLCDHKPAIFSQKRAIFSQKRAIFGPSQAINSGPQGERTKISRLEPKCGPDL